MSFFVKAVSISLIENSAVNAMIKEDEIIHYNYADIGVAVSTEKGLMVPVVRNAQNMNLIQIEKEIARLADKARQGKISLDDLSGGTFTISNGGVFGSMLSTPILNPPQSAILGMHNIIDRPIAKNGEVIIAPMMYLALSYDHRIIDGKESVTFLKRIKELLENPEFLLTGDHPVEKLLDL
jgi:2-oxoglutarate dehydrogenase E2 component (dihydrolipoamide succinyltransferase)